MFYLLFFLLLFLVYVSGQIPLATEVNWHEIPFKHEDPTSTDIYPARRGGGSVIFNDIIVLFGGRVASHTNKTVDYTGLYWSNGQLTNSSSRYNVTQDSYSCPNMCFGFGTCTLDSTVIPAVSYCLCDDGNSGIDCSFEELDVWMYDLWFFNLKTLTFNQIKPQYSQPGVILANSWPQERVYFSTALLSFNSSLNGTIYNSYYQNLFFNGTANVMVIYGGVSQLCEDYCSDVWMFNLDTNIWTSDFGFTSQNGPGKRWGHAAITYKGDMYIFGGHNLLSMHGDIWKYSINLSKQAFQWTLVAAAYAPLWKSGDTQFPVGRVGHSLAVYKDTMYMYGGFTFSSDTSDSQVSIFLDDMWVFDFVKVTWTQVTYPTSQSVRPPQLMGYSFAVLNDQIVMFGGYLNNIYYNDIWRFNISNSCWISQRIYFAETTLPAERSWPVMQLRNNSLYVVGGYGYIFPEGTVDKTAVSYREVHYNDIWKFDFTKCPNNCNNRGYCEYGFCYCDPGYWGLDCQKQVCNSTSCTYDPVTREQICVHCNGHGICRNGACECNSYYGGERCEQALCLNSCSNHGDCVFTSSSQPVCSCKSSPILYIGSDCSTLGCLNNCTNVLQGSCGSDGKCVCAKCFSGDDCSISVLKCSCVFLSLQLLFVILITIFLV